MRWHEKLARLRAERRLSQADLARSVGLQASRISRWEGGDGAPSLAQGLALARALGVPLDYLADDSQADPPSDRPASLAMERILAIVAELGEDVALKRLILAPEVRHAPGATYGEIRRGEGKPRLKGSNSGPG